MYKPKQDRFQNEMEIELENLRTSYLQYEEMWLNKSGKYVKEETELFKRLYETHYNYFKTFALLLAKYFPTRFINTRFKP
jgi:predicted RNA-binding protein with EMAP domain